MKLPLAALVVAISAAPGAAGAVAGVDLADLPPSQVVILGEVHDNPIHHRNQADAVAALGPAAIVFEMMTPRQAARVTPLLRGSPQQLAMVLDWAASGWPDFALYHPIMAAAPGAAVVGGGLPRDEVRAAMTEGAAPVFGAGAADYGLDLPLAADEQAAREALQAEAHCDALPPGMLPGMVAAQRLRDAALARAVLAALDEHGAPVVLITGTGHADRERGVPAMLRLAAPGVDVVSVAQLEADPGPDAPYDFWVVTEPAPREDPCAALRG